MVKEAPTKFVEKVMRNHYRTQSILSESSTRAEKECNMSVQTIRKVGETIRTWRDAYEHFQSVIDAKV